MREIPYPHPGEILMHEFLEPMGISQYRLAKEIGVSQRRIGMSSRLTLCRKGALDFLSFTGNHVRAGIGHGYSIEHPAPAVSQETSLPIVGKF